MVTLSREQRRFVRALLKNLPQEQVQTLGGYAGTGKTTVLATLADRLPEFAPCAFTGKAAHVMTRKGMPASTIHSLIYTPVPRPGGGVEFRLKQPCELGCRGFLVDEASMVGPDLHSDLLRFGLPIIFVGDHGQLPPVGSDIHLMADPDYRLEQIHRNAGPIAYFAEHLRKGKAPHRFHADGRVRIVSPTEVTDEALLEAGQVICAFNRTRVGFNSHLRRLRGRAGKPKTGDRIICLRNNRDTGLFNGQQGRVLAVYPGKLPRLDFKSCGVVYEGLAYDPETFGAEKPHIDYSPDATHPFDFGYCITTHKAQGSEWKRLLVFEQLCSGWDHKRWVYTAASRAKRSLVWVAQRR